MNGIRIVMAMSLGLALSGCGVKQRLGFGTSEPEVALPFKAKLAKGEQPRDFSVRVEAPGATLEQARESARHPAISYCLLTFGGSEIDWSLGADGDWQTLRDDKGGLTVSGTCTVR